MNKKEKLISSLKIVIEALNSNTIKYDWKSQQSCNCGLVAQAVLGMNAKDLAARTSKEKVFEKAGIGSMLGIEKEQVESTWRNAVKAYCPLTGAPLKEIFQDLEAAGLSKHDIAHLEYMSNPAILKRSGIQTVKKTTKSVLKEYKLIPGEKWWQKLFDVQVSVPVYEDEVYEEPIHKYYASPENLVKYLSAWVSILEETTPDTERTIENLHAAKLVAEAEERYEDAAKLRDEIITLSAVA